jgi:hypothetical protein
MTTYNIFYDSNKNISWVTDGPTPAEVIAAQSALGLTHVALDLEQIPPCDQYYINDTEDGVTSYSDFALSFSATTIAVDAVVTITGCPADTEIFLDEVSQGTYSNGALTLTGSMGGSFMITFVKDKYYTARQRIIVSRYE